MNVREYIRSKIGKVPFFQTISMQIEMMDAQGSRLRITSTEKHENLWRTIHGGVIASLVDAACSASLIPILMEDEMLMTATLQVQYLAPVRSGDLVGQGRVIRRGKCLAYAEADIFNDQNKLIAKGNTSFMIMNGVKYIHTLNGVNGHDPFPD